MKFIIIAIGIGLLVLLFKGDRRKKEMEQGQTSEKMKASGDMVKDPICGTFVRSDGDIRVRQGEKVHSFCSYECRDKFLKQLEAEKDDSEA